LVTGGAVDASPLITGGTVYIGSADHVFYARAETTGAAVWSQTTGGAIHSSATDESNEVYVGSDDGTLYGFAPATGSRLLALNLQSPVTGVSAAIGNTFSETAGGTLYGQRAAYQNWQQQDGTALSGSPSVVDSAIYVGAGDGTLTCYSLFGLAPAV
jgi:outer membrane protein assembly factor BamB